MPATRVRSADDYNKYLKPWRAANPEKVTEQIKRSYESKKKRKGAATLNAERTAWLEAHPEKKDEYKANARAAAKLRSTGRTTEYQRKHYESATGRIVYMLWGARNRARKKGFGYDLDREWLLAKVEAGICEATGIPFDMGMLGNHKKNPWGPSIDRIDSSIGYLKSNCRVTCCAFNIGKTDMTDDEFAKMARAFLSRYDNKADKS